VQCRGLGMKFNLLFVLFTFLAHRFLPKYDVCMQLLMFQIRMLCDRVDDQRIVPKPEERAELLRLGNEINHDVADVMLVQVCASLADPRVKQSEVRSLSEAMVELAVAEGTIVTWRTDEIIPVGFGTIQVVPVWRFLLEMEPRT